MQEQLTQERISAQLVKQNTRVLVCIGNPPYDRESRAPAENDDSRRKGGWVRHGEPGLGGATPILEDFIAPVREGGRGHSSEEPLQRLRLLLAVGALEGARDVRPERRRHRHVHHRIVLPARSGVRRYAPQDARSVRRSVDHRPRGRQPGGAPRRRTSSPFRRRLRLPSAFATANPIPVSLPGSGRCDSPAAQRRSWFVSIIRTPSRRRSPLASVLNRVGVAVLPQREPLGCVFRLAVGH